MTTKNTVQAVWDDGYEEVARLLSILGFKRVEAGPRGVSAIVPDPADLAEQACDLAECMAKLGLHVNVHATFNILGRNGDPHHTSDARIVMSGAHVNDQMLGPIEYALVKMNKPGETRSVRCVTCPPLTPECRLTCTECRGLGTVQEELPPVEDVETAPRYAGEDLKAAMFGRDPDDYDFVPVRPRLSANLVARVPVVDG